MILKKIFFKLLFLFFVLLTSDPCEIHVSYMWAGSGLTLLAVWGTIFKKKIRLFEYVLGIQIFLKGVLYTLLQSLDFVLWVC